jgi:hypothetical protein
MDDTITPAEMADASETSIDTLRYYEREGCSSGSRAHRAAGGATVPRTSHGCRCCAATATHNDDRSA